MPTMRETFSLVVATLSLLLLLPLLSGATRTEYDYVVVGAGSAGSIVATRLFEAGHSVKVIERGTRIPDDNINAKFLGLASQDWLPPYVRDELLMPNSIGARADILVPDVEGGGGMVNSGIAHLGARGYWNSWGFSEWGYDHIVPSYNALRARVSFQPAAYVPDSALKWIASGASVSFLNPDLSGAAGTPTEGFGNITVNTRSSPIGPVRDTTLFEYLDTATGVDISLKAHATRVIFNNAEAQNDARDENNAQEQRNGGNGGHGGDGHNDNENNLPRAKAVEYVEDGECKTVQAKKGVVLCAGAIGSAELLMRSGVGNAADLAALGIQSVADLPVGAGLKDHHVIIAAYVNTCPFPATDLGAFILTPGTPVAGFIHSNVSASPYPDIQYSFVPLGVTPAGLSLDLFILSVFLVDPDSTGSVKLSSSDPLKPSIKSYDYPGTTRDVQALANSIEVAETFMATPPFSACLGPRVAPPPGADLGAYIRSTSQPAYHVACTNAMGKVVDQTLRVMGTRRLFVVDASVMPRISNCNTNVPTEIIAERGVSMILAAGQ